MQTQERPTQSFDRRDWQRGYESQRQESAYWIENIEGEIPQELDGTLFRNGPGLLDVNGQRLHHPFDGDGMVCAIAFRHGRAHFRNRFVRTEGFLAEQKAGKILYRGVFGTQKPGGWLANIFDLNGKNIANTNVLYWGNKLLALWEGGNPHRLDPHTLETIGTDSLGGLLQSGDPFTAHPRIADDKLIGFSVKPGLSTTITLFEFDREGVLLQQYSHVVPGFAFLHDMAITPNYCIFAQNPVLLNPIPYMLGFKAAGQCLQFRADQPTKLLLVPRNGGQMRILETQACFVFHHANAWEEGDKVYLDSICYEYFPNVEPDADYLDVDFESYPAGQLWRFEMDLSADSATYQVVESRPCEFPALHPDRTGQPHRYLYLGTTHNPARNAPLQAFVKIDNQTGDRQVWSLAPRGFAGEPTFVPRPGGTAEDDGWLLALVYDAAHHRSDVLIFNAQRLNEGPIAKLHLNYHIPYGLHGYFTGEYFAPSDA